MYGVQYASIASVQLILTAVGFSSTDRGTEYGFRFGESEPIIHWLFFYQKLSCLGTEDTMAFVLAIPSYIDYLYTSPYIISAFMYARHTILPVSVLTSQVAGTIHRPIHVLYLSRIYQLSSSMPPTSR